MEILLIRPRVDDFIRWVFVRGHYTRNIFHIMHCACVCSGRCPSAQISIVLLFFWLVVGYHFFFCCLSLEMQMSEGWSSKRTDKPKTHFVLFSHCFSNSDGKLNSFFAIAHCCAWSVLSRSHKNVKMTDFPIFFPPFTSKPYRLSCIDFHNLRSYKCFCVIWRKLLDILDFPQGEGDPKKASSLNRFEATATFYRTWKRYYVIDSPNRCVTSFEGLLVRCIYFRWCQLDTVNGMWCYCC